MAEQKFVLVHTRSPGDIICLTPLLRDIKETFGDRFEVDVWTSCMDLWKHNPYRSAEKLYTLRTDGGKQTPIGKPGVRILRMTYGEGIEEQKYEPMHFVGYFHKDFKRKTGIDVPLTLPYGDLHFSEEEKIPVIEGGQRYWTLLSGGKSDFTIKVWRSSYFQEVVDGLLDLGLGVVQTGSNADGHWHPHLEGTLNLVGKSSLRDMMRLIHQGDGVICGVTAAMHMAAALQSPCVCLAGGREAWWWEAYVRENKGLPNADKLRVPHRFLHTIGMLDCCKTHGCWRNKVVPIEGSNDKQMCYLPVHYPDMPIAKCMDLLTPEIVLDNIKSYYYDGTLTPPPGSKLEAEVRALHASSQAMPQVQGNEVR